jgi:radical SAM protein with 4Fe4S-binding SPASM domain
MTFVRLNKRSYIRKYEHLGYVFNELTHSDVVFDECGAIFLSQIGREPTHIEAAGARIASNFLDANEEEVQTDFRDFIGELERGGFVITGDSISELDDKEPIFSYSNGTPGNDPSDLPDEGHAPSSEVLKKHFWKFPRLFDVQIELTSFCNLKCIHCYLGDSHPQGGMEKSTVLSILDQLKSMGTLQVSFTGGEICSRRDLPEILRHARRNDLSISLLTNNTLLTDELVAVFTSTGVRLVKISLYSMSPDIHDLITGHPGSWKKTVSNIEKLIASNVPIQISCPIMRQNLDSFAEVMQWGRTIRCNVKPDLLLTARADFSRANLDHRLSLSECKKAIRSIIAVDVDYQKRMSLEYGANNIRHPDDHICGVGTSTLCIGANGDLYPCPAFHKKLGNVDDASIQEFWEHSSLVRELRGVKYASFSKCSVCPSSNYCPICMGKFYNESGGDIHVMSDFFCGVSHLTKEVVEEFLNR